MLNVENKNETLSHIDILTPDFELPLLSIHC